MTDILTLLTVFKAEEKPKIWALWSNRDLCLMITGKKKG